MLVQASYKPEFVCFEIYVTFTLYGILTLMFYLFAKMPNELGSMRTSVSMTNLKISVWRESQNTTNYHNLILYQVYTKSRVFFRNEYLLLSIIIYYQMLHFLKENGVDHLNIMPCSSRDLRIYSEVTSLRFLLYFMKREGMYI